MFIAVIAALVQAVTFAIRAIDPVLHQVLGIYLPLITTNCAVLGVALLASDQHLSLFATILYALGAAFGFTLVITMFAALRERLDEIRVPTPFRGAPIQLVTAGLMSLDVTCAPARAAARPIMPEPVPRSRNCFPRILRASTKRAKIRLLPKYLG